MALTSPNGLHDSTGLVGLGDEPLAFRCDDLWCLGAWFLEISYYYPPLNVYIFVFSLARKEKNETLMKSLAMSVIVFVSSMIFIMPKYFGNPVGE